MPIIRTVIEKYGIFSLVMDEDGESFFSVRLNDWMKPYFKKIEENRIKGIKSGLARKKKIEKEIKELELSQVNSTKPQFNRSSTNRIEEKRIEERKENTTTSSSCITGIYEEWLEEKSKNAKNPQAYKATLLQMYREGEKSAIEEFDGWLKQKERQKKIEKLIFFQNKKIMLEEGEIYEILGIEDKEDGLHVYLNHPYQNSQQILFSSIEEIEKRDYKQNCVNPKTTPVW